jgi:hypothetical protein
MARPVLGPYAMIESAAVPLDRPFLGSGSAANRTALARPASRAPRYLARSHWDARFARRLLHKPPRVDFSCVSKTCRRVLATSNRSR